jgi:hypothetical protein
MKRFESRLRSHASPLQCANGVIRKDIDLLGAFIDPCPALLCRRGESFGLLTADSPNFIPISGFKSSLVASRMHRDLTKYLELHVSDGVRYFTSFDGGTVLKANSINKKVIEQILESNKTGITTSMTADLPHTPRR